MATKKNEKKLYKAPSCLSKIAKKKWDELIILLDENRVITPSDLMALETLCMNYGMSIELYNAMVDQSSDNTAGGYFIGRNSQTMAEFNGYYKCQATYMRLLNEFGLTPKSRKNINIEADDEGSDPITEMIEN